MSDSDNIEGLCDCICRQVAEIKVNVQDISRTDEIRICQAQEILAEVVGEVSPITWSDD
jgi:hypothetical protein